MDSSRRQFLAGGLAAAASGCRRRDSSPSRRTLRVATGADRYNVSPGRYTFTTTHPNVHVAETPVGVNRNFEPSPGLFEEWRHEGKGWYRARLRPKVRFHDGSHLNADVFLKSAARFIAPRDFIGLDAASLQKLDELTVRFRSTTESALMIDNMTHPAASVLLPSGDVSMRPSGTGPYRLLRYDPQRSIEVERFADYWGPKPPQERIRFRFMPDPQGRLLALQAGEVDLIADVDPVLLLGLADRDSSVTLHCSRPIKYVALTCNLRGEPPFQRLRDVSIRRALAYAIDRASIAKSMYAGRGQAARGLLPGWMFGLGEDQPAGFTFDPEKAKELLAKAGWDPGSDGVRRKGEERLQLRLVAAFPTASSVRPIPEMLAQMFLRVGVALEIVEVEDDQLYYSGYADSGQGDLFLELAANANADPTFLLRNLFHSRTPWRSYRYVAPGGDVDSLLDQAKQAEDRKAAIAFVREAHRRIIDIHVAAIPILMAPVMLLSHPKLHIEPFENIDWMNLGEAWWMA